MSQPDSRTDFKERAQLKAQIALLMRNIKDLTTKILNLEDTLKQKEKVNLSNLDQLELSKRHNNNLLLKIKSLQTQKPLDSKTQSFDSIFVQELQLRIKENEKWVLLADDLKSQIAYEKRMKKGLEDQLSYSNEIQKINVSLEKENNELKESSRTCINQIDSISFSFSEQINGLKNEIKFIEKRDLSFGVLLINNLFIWKELETCIINYCSLFSTLYPLKTTITDHKSNHSNHSNQSNIITTDSLMHSLQVKDQTLFNKYILAESILHHKTLFEKNKWETLIIHHLDQIYSVVSENHFNEKVVAYHLIQLYYCWQFKLDSENIKSSPITMILKDLVTKNSFNDLNLEQGIIETVFQIELIEKELNDSREVVIEMQRMHDEMSKQITSIEKELLKEREKSQGLQKEQGLKVSSFENELNEFKEKYSKVQSLIKNKEEIVTSLEKKMKSNDERVFALIKQNEELSELVAGNQSHSVRENKPSQEMNLNHNQEPISDQDINQSNNNQKGSSNNNQDINQDRNSNKKEKNHSVYNINSLLKRLQEADALATRYRIELEEIKQENINK